MSLLKTCRCLLGSLLVLVFVGTSLAGEPKPKDDNFPYLEATVAQLQAAMAKGEITSEQLAKAYIQRIMDMDQNGPNVNSVIELNPDALDMARHADQLRKMPNATFLPLLGIPVLLKDNVDTGDKMQTSAGSYGLVGEPALQDSTVAAKLRAGGAVILGKTNLSEWANFRSFESVSGWSGRGGQTNNPYGIARNPCGSSSGSGAATSANFSVLSFGTETDGSIVCPAHANGIAGIKPTVGLTSRAGIVPISHTQDTFGPLGRTVADAAAALSVVQSRTCDLRDPATCTVPLGWKGRYSRPTNIPNDYTKFVDPNGLKGAVIGVTRYGQAQVVADTSAGPTILQQFDAAVQAMKDAGATVIDLDAEGFQWPTADGEFLVLCYEFRQDVEKYFATRVGVPMAHNTLAQAIQFNIDHADVEMPYFNQDLWDLTDSLAPGPDDPQPAFNGMTYNQALEIDRQFGINGIDAALSQFGLDAVVAPTADPPWATDLIYGESNAHYLWGSPTLAAAEGYPIVQVPAGMVYGAPVGISFIGTAFSEPTLIKLASGFEAVTQVRAHNLPTFARTVPNDHIDGTSLHPRKNLTVPPAVSKGKAPASKSAETSKSPAKKPHAL